MWAAGLFEISVVPKGEKKKKEKKKKKFGVDHLKYSKYKGFQAIQEKKKLWSKK